MTMTQCVSKPDRCIVHFDATGSMIKKEPRTYLYMMVGEVNHHKISALPLVQWLAINHDAKSIASMLSIWKIMAGGTFIDIGMIVTDMFFALLNACSIVFGQRSFKSQMVAQWKLMLKSEIEHGIILLRLSVNHYMPVSYTHLTLPTIYSV